MKISFINKVIGKIYVVTKDYYYAFANSKHSVYIARYNKEAFNNGDYSTIFKVWELPDFERTLVNLKDAYYIDLHNKSQFADGVLVSRLTTKNQTRLLAKFDSVEKSILQESLNKIIKYLQRVSLARTIAADKGEPDPYLFISADGYWYGLDLDEQYQQWQEHIHEKWGIDLYPTKYKVIYEAPDVPLEDGESIFGIEA